MPKFFLGLLILVALTGCHDNLNSAYDNVHDYRSENYVPDAPQNFKVIEYSDTSVVMQWDDMSNGEDGFIIEMKLYDQNVSSTYEQIGKVSKNVNIFEYHYKFIPGRYYFFKVWAFYKNNLSQKYIGGYLRL